jgi:hypothetical protein
MKKTAAGLIILICTVIAVFLAFAAGITFYKRQFFMGDIIAVFTAGMAAFLFARKAYVPTGFFNVRGIPSGDGIAGPVGESALAEDRLSAIKMGGGSGYAGAFLGSETTDNKTAGKERDVPPDEALLAALARSVPELNVKSGLAHAGKNKDAYFNTLRHFCEEYDEYIREIVHFTAEENGLDYSAKLRLLGNIFANMGNGHLSAWAHKLELAFGEDDNAICRNETEPFCYAMYLFKEKLAAAMLLVTDDENNE